MSDVIADLLLAITHARAGRQAKAEQLLQSVLADDPHNAHALCRLGQGALADGRAGEAAQHLARALAGRPAHRDSRLMLARAQLAVGKAAEALATLDPLESDKDLAGAQTLRGTALGALGRPLEAITAFSHAIEVNPGDAEAHLNLGNAHAELDEPEAAERHIRRAIAQLPTLLEAHVSLGHLLTSQGRLAEAMAASAAALALDPDCAVAQWNHGVALLLGGDMAAGWDKYEWRKRRFPACFHGLPGPQWQGEPLNGRTILVLAEQGLGDTIQFARYLPLLARRGARVVLQCAGSLAPLLGGLAGVAATCERGEPPAHDFWVDQMSLPRLFGTTLANVPYRAGYLSPDPVRTAHWDRLLPDGLRIGLVWAGNALHSNDRRRSMPVEALAPIVAAGGTIISLQAGVRAREVSYLPGVADQSAQLADWSETAALVSALDLVISVDTAVAHLAGALGIPAWVMLPHAPDWRWLLVREDSPWYASVRLFRQHRPGDWGGVVARVAAALAQIAAPQSMAMPPLTCSVAPVTQAASSDAR